MDEKIKFRDFEKEPLTEEEKKVWAEDTKAMGHDTDTAIKHYIKTDA